MLKEYDDMKEEIKNLKFKQSIKNFSLFIERCCSIVSSVQKIEKVKT